MSEATKATAEKPTDAKITNSSTTAAESAVSTTLTTAAPDAPASAPTTTTAKPPEKYDLKLPDGTPLDSSEIEKTADYARERGLSNDAAQELLRRDHEAVMGYIDRAKEQVAQWASQAQADKEIGGDAFAGNVETAKRFFDRFGSPALKKALNDTGLGNHPELIRLGLKAGKAMADDSFVKGGGSPETKKSPAEVAYPHPDNYL